MRRLLQVALVSLAVPAMSAVASACPTCRSALAGGAPGWAHGFALSIAVLLGVLGLGAASFGVALWRATRGPA